MNALYIDKAFKSMHKSVITNIKNFGMKDWIVKAIKEHSIYTYEGNCIEV